VNNDKLYPDNLHHWRKFLEYMKHKLKVLIVSSHPLFSEGIKYLIQARLDADVRVVGVVSNVSEAVQTLEKFGVDLVILDHDDHTVNQDEFLLRFVGGKKRLRVVLLSLMDAGSTAIVYDRRSMEATQIDDWLQGLTGENDDDFHWGRMRLDSVKEIVTRGSSGMKHTFGVLFLIIVLTVLSLFVLRTDILLPIEASAQAGIIDRLFSLHFRLIAVLFALIVGTLVYSLIFFRRKKGDPDDVIYEKGDTSLNINFIIFPMASVLSYVIIESINAFKNFYIEAFPVSSISFEAFAAGTSVLVGAVLYFILFPPHKKQNQSEETAKENRRLEIAWIALPLGIVLAFAIIGSDALAQTQRTATSTLEVRITGQQWSWSFEYPEYGITSTELILPVGKQVLLTLTSVDVIHSFWVPEFRVKQDALPGMVRELLVTPSRIGEYNLVCSEMCGSRHAYMTAPVRVVTAEGFDAWKAEQLASISDDPVVRGQVWYKQYGCAACHTTDGTPLVGPSFLGLLGKEESFEDGISIIVDEAYIYESIVNPAARIVQGYPNAMPVNFADRMSEEQIQDIIAFLSSLK
jgi:cytochrome c oxidase subunit 2